MASAVAATRASSIDANAFRSLTLTSTTPSPKTSGSVVQTTNSSRMVLALRPESLRRA